MSKKHDNEPTGHLLKAFEDLPPATFTEFRQYADELGVSIEALAQVATANFIVSTGSVSRGPKRKSVESGYIHGCTHLRNKYSSRFAGDGRQRIAHEAS